MQSKYRLLDSGKGRKLEQFGPFRLSRPSAQALWTPRMATWEGVSALFTRDPDGVWDLYETIPSDWKIEAGDIQFKLSLTDFGHLGIFPEQIPFWRWIRQKVEKASKTAPIKVLNLFAYSGGSTMAAALGGASVCHLDASKKMVAWARENAALNGLESAPIRWIVDDVTKFLRREVKRGMLYDALILDPPSFGRGAQGEIFKIEKDLPEILSLCRLLLTPRPTFILLSCHSPGFTPTTLRYLLEEMDKGGNIDQGEMFLEGERPLPSGIYARIEN